MNSSTSKKSFSGFPNLEKHYPGTELELFRKAFNWKKIIKSLLEPYLTGEILEVGAGIGGSTHILCTGKQKRWICLEPDPNLAEEIKYKIAFGELPPYCELRIGTIVELNSEEKFDSILYIDVLEHIQNDRQELMTAEKHIKPDGILAILAPAHQWLFSPFDKAVGHYRRYNRTRLQKKIPSSLSCKEFKYLDSIGLFASMANKIFLKRKVPSDQQIMTWDKAMVPISRKLDPILGYRIGKSVLGVWKKVYK